MSTKFNRHSREFRDLDGLVEDSAVFIDTDDYKDKEKEEASSSNTDDGSFHTKQQNRDVEVNVSELPTHLDGYEKPKEPPFRSGLDSFNHGTIRKTSDTITGGDGKPLYSYRESSGYNYGSSSGAVGNSKGKGSPKPGVTYEGSSTKGIVPPYKKYKPKN